uniref:Rpl33 n=1 Tax=Arundo donax TaxID=35708 RepID=A0A0A9ACA9_ARUDO
MFYILNKKFLLFLFFGKIEHTMLLFLYFVMSRMLATITTKFS